jgi:hypothetical protein
VKFGDPERAVGRDHGGYRNGARTGHRSRSEAPIASHNLLRAPRCRRIARTVHTNIGIVVNLERSMRLDQPEDLPPCSADAYA